MKQVAEKKALKKPPHDLDDEDFGKGVFDNGNDNNNNNNTNFKEKKWSAPLPTTKAKRTKVDHETKAAKVKELPTNMKSETQQ